MPRIESALVTGAASGIGRCFAETLARRGARLVLLDVDARGLETTAESVRAHGANVRAAVADVGDPSKIAAATRGEGSEPPGIDLVVNCAAILGGGPWLDQPPEDLERVIRVDLLGTVNVIRATLPALQRRRGRAVVLASTAALHGWPQLVGYSAAKFGLVGFCEAVRAELERKDVGLTIVFPLLIDTPLINRPDTPPILKKGRRVPPQLVVDKVLSDVVRGKRRVYVPATTRFVALLHGLAPGVLDWLGERAG